MKARWKVMAVLAAAGVCCVFFLFSSDSSEQKALEETRRALRQKGFKTDLSEFHFSTSEEMRARAVAITAIGHTVRPTSHPGDLAFLPSAVRNPALVVWKMDKFKSHIGEARWPALRERLNESRAELDAACESALAGPIRFDLNASAGNSMLLPHIPAMTRLAQKLGARVLLELHDGNQEAAWTNLLAASRLVTAWEPEPVEISHVIRFSYVTIAFDATWQALQADGWSDDRLARLQQEWQSVDFFNGLPETAAFKRASIVSTCQLERRQPLGGLGLTLKESLRSPQSAWAAFTDYRRRVWYREHGTYEEEKALLLHYCDREQEIRRAVKSATWSEMRQLPGVTNFIAFQSKYPSKMLDVLNARQLMLASLLHAQGEGQSWLGRAAAAEARRGLITVAIALARYRGRHGSFPSTLQELVPELLKNPPGDFMDGKPLRYRRTDDGHFVLYSVGLDCVDHGGEMPRQPQGSRYTFPGKFGSALGADLVWPRPTSTGVVE